MKEFLLHLKRILFRIIGREIKEEVVEIKEELIDELKDLLEQLGDIKEQEGQDDLDVHDCSECCGCQCCAHHHEEEQPQEEDQPEE